MTENVKNQTYQTGRKRMETGIGSFAFPGCMQNLLARYHANMLPVAQNGHIPEIQLIRRVVSPSK